MGVICKGICKGNFEKLQISYLMELNIFYIINCKFNLDFFVGK